MLIPKLEKGHFESRARCEIEFVIYYEFPARVGDNWFDYYQKLINSNAKVGIESELPIGIVNKTPGEFSVYHNPVDLRHLVRGYIIGINRHLCSTSCRRDRIDSGQDDIG